MATENGEGEEKRKKEKKGKTKTKKNCHHHIIIIDQKLIHTLYPPFVHLSPPFAVRIGHLGFSFLVFARVARPEASATATASDRWEQVERWSMERELSALIIRHSLTHSQ